VIISVVAEGDRLRYRWQRNGRKLATHSHTLHFRATDRKSGVYQAMVIDRAGNYTVSSPAVLVVQPRTPVPDPEPQPQPQPSPGAPVIVTQPQNVTVAEHGTAVFRVTLNNSGPYTTIVWHNDNPLEGPHQIPDNLGFDVHSTQLAIPNCLDADNYNGLYWIAVTNASGGTISSKARLTVVR
jgi:hypothetical protein